MSRARGNSNRGRGGRGGGRGSSVVTASGLPAHVDKLVPAQFKACIGWRELSLSEEKYEILKEEEYLDAHVSKAIIDSYIHAVDSLDRRLNELGLDVNSANAMEHLLSGAALVELSKYTSQQLVKKGFNATTSFELRRFLGTKYLRSRFRMPTKEAWEQMKTNAVKHGFKLMELERYNNIMSCLRGYDVPSRTGNNGDETWLRRHKLLRNLNPLELSIFKESVSVLFNTKNGSVVIDDELISSRAQDVESKVVSNRKSGKDGPQADCLADSLICLLFGMRLRVSGESQRENVNKLLENLSSLPGITSADANPEMKMDRGYADADMLAGDSLQPFSCNTICKDSSRNPFIPNEKFEEKKNSWRGNKHFQVFEGSSTAPKKEQFLDDSGNTKTRNMLDPEKLKQCTDIFSSFVLDGDKMSGTAVRMATKDIVKPTGKKTMLTATAIRDTFDKKNPCKDLLFLSTGKNARNMRTTFVASTKTKLTVTSSHLFSNTKGSPERQRIEEHLRSNKCEPLTIGQKCIDWFALKGNCITGTMGGKIYTEAKRLVDDALFDEDEEDVPNEILQKILDDCVDGWYGRDHVSTSAMAEGTKNEEPTFQSFSQFDFVLDAFEVGLLRWNGTSDANIGASPDGIAVVKVPGAANNEHDPQIVSVEIKTRVAETTIVAAEEARSWAADGKHSVDDDGKFVVCDYDDEVFKNCVPAHNRKQIIHQAVVTGLTWGVFITAKVEDAEGSIVQVVFVRMSEDTRGDYLRKLLIIAKPVSGWLLNAAAISRGYLEDGDLPTWIASSVAKILKSHFKMWSAWWRRVQDDGPFAPVGQLKHAVNFSYNKGKWGLDMCTENYHKIHNHTSATSFETKYICRMVDGVLANVWKVAQGRLVKRYVLAYRKKHDGKNPSVSKVRSKCDELPLEGFVLKFAIEWLRNLETEHNQLLSGDIRVAFGRQRLNSPSRTRDTGALTAAVADAAATIDHRKQQGKWPIKQKRMEMFHQDPQLKAIRLLSCPQFHHHKTTVPKEKTCALCSSRSSQRKIRSSCSICEVTLCTMGRPPNDISCWDAWHRVTNLREEHEIRSGALITNRDEHKESNQSKHTARMATARRRRSREDVLTGDDNNEGATATDMAASMANSNEEASPSKRTRTSESEMV